MLYNAYIIYIMHNTLQYSAVTNWCFNYFLLHVCVPQTAQTEDLLTQTAPSFLFSK